METWSSELRHALLSNSPIVSFCHLQAAATPTSSGITIHGHHGQAACGLQGLPFCVAGTGDLLALFRCISCRYCFSTDATKPELLGAPGRVFTTQEVKLIRLTKLQPCMT